MSIDVECDDDAAENATKASCACSSCCLTGCLGPILIIVLIWIGMSLARIANHQEEPQQPAIEEAQDAPTE